MLARARVRRRGSMPARRSGARAYLDGFFNDIATDEMRARKSSSAASRLVAFSASSFRPGGAAMSLPS